MTGQGKLRFGVVHHDDVAHAGCRRTAAKRVALDESHAHASACEGGGASRAYNAAAGNDHVEGCVVLIASPSLSNAVAKWIRGIEEERCFGGNVCRSSMLGYTCPFSRRTRPSKTVPRIPSCLQTSPSDQFAVSNEACHLGARSGSAGRSIVGLTRAKHEVAAMVGRVLRRPEKLDVIVTSEPLGSLTTADRKRSCWLRKRSSLSDNGPSPRSGPPLTTTCVGSPPVWESMTRTLWHSFRIICGSDERRP